MNEHQEKKRGKKYLKNETQKVENENRKKKNLMKEKISHDKKVCNFKVALVGVCIFICKHLKKKKKKAYKNRFTIDYFLFSIHKV